MGPHHAWRLLCAARVVQPLAKVVLAMHQKFVDVLDDLQALAFRQAPQQVVGCKGIEVRVEAADLAQSGTVECQYAPYIRQAAHQVEVEVRLEDGCCRAQPVMATFVDIDAGPLAKCHALAHDRQSMGHQAVASAQQQDPVGIVGTRQARLQLGQAIALHEHAFNRDRVAHQFQRRRRQQPAAGRGPGLRSKAVEGRAQGQFLTRLGPDHRHDTRLPGPLLEALGQRLELCSRQVTALQPLGIYLFKRQAVSANLLRLAGLLSPVQAVEFVLVPRRALLALVSLQRQIAHPATGRSGLACPRGQHCLYPVGLDGEGQGHACLVTQARRVQALHAEKA